MVTILWYSFQLPPGLGFLGTPTASFVLSALAWVLIAFLVDLVLSRFLRWVMRNLPGEVEDIVLGIIHRPVIALIILYGTTNSLSFLPLTPVLEGYVKRIVNTILVLVIVHLSWRLIKDILVHYGEKWARKTESQVDDVVLPVLNLFGPFVILINAGLIILPMWGLNVTSVLLGAGVVGLILGLALQETLSNVFSGMSLLIEAPFRTGDMVVLADGRVVEVERLGMRSTQFYSVNDHSTIFVPNKVLSADSLVNITKPTVEQRVPIDVKVGLSSNMAHVQEMLRQIALAHPCVVAADISEKIPVLCKRIEQTRRRADLLSEYDSIQEMLVNEALKYEQAIPKLELEAKFNQQMAVFIESLRNLIRGIHARESKGLSAGELQELHCRFVAPAEAEMQKVFEFAEKWAAVQDPWVIHSDYWDDRKLWTYRNEQLRLRWERLKKEVYNPHPRMEMLLDDLAKKMIDWLGQEYKVLPGYWKNPKVVFQNFDGAEAHLQLWFYVDNIRLEHGGRAQRVKTEIARQIREQFTEAGIW